MEKKYVIGVDLGGTKIYTALVDLEGNMKKEVIVETETEKGDASLRSTASVIKEERDIAYIKLQDVIFNDILHVVTNLIFEEE